MKQLPYALHPTEVTLIAGTSYSRDGDVTGLHGTTKDYWIVKLSAAGNIAWQKTLGGSDADEAIHVSVDANGNCFVAGTSESKKRRCWYFTME
jgi:hypothetical protein